MERDSITVRTICRTDLLINVTVVCGDAMRSVVNSFASKTNNSKYNHFL